jgi:hypothetical protein
LLLGIFDHLPGVPCIPISLTRGTLVIQVPYLDDTSPMIKQKGPDCLSAARRAA